MGDRYRAEIKSKKRQSGYNRITHLDGAFKAAEARSQAFKGKSRRPQGHFGQKATQGRLFE